ncbi:MAG: 30S ribosomal protein S17 [DPANN group archaeon]|nr:30S ribosomal protein S17 [DPANN group archaeon]
MNRRIGIDVPTPKEQKGLEPDRHSPFTGSIKVRGRTFTGTVLSTKMARTATVSWSRMQYNPKYERYVRRWTKVHAHNPEVINAQKGDVVKIAETRPISKTKNFVIVQILGTDIDSQIKEENKEIDLKVKVDKDNRKKRQKQAHLVTGKTGEDTGSMSSSVEPVEPVGSDGSDEIADPAKVSDDVDARHSDVTDSSSAGMGETGSPSDKGQESGQGPDEAVEDRTAEVRKD